MAGRFPFDASGHNGNNPMTNLRAALGLGSIEEAVYLQRQQELQRDFHLRQMLLQEQMEQQTRLESMLHEQQLKAIGDQLQEFPDLQQHYSRLLLNEQLQRSEERSLAHDRLRMQAEEELRRRQLLAQQHQHHQPQALDQLETPLPDVAVASAAAAASSPVAPTSPQLKVQGHNQAVLRDIAADSLAGNAVRRSDFDKRTYAKPEHDAQSPAKKRARSTSEPGDLEATKQKPKKEKKPKKQEKPAAAAAAGKRGASEKKRGKSLKPSALALLDFASASTKKTSSTKGKRSDKTASVAVPAVKPKRTPLPIRPVGTLGDILEAAECEDRNGIAAQTLVDIKENVAWSESEEEDDAEEMERIIAINKGDTIQLPNFSSFLPQLPEEPELEGEKSSKKRKKHKSLLDDDSVDEASTTQRKNEKTTKGSKDVKEKNPDGSMNDLLYPIDTWWPSVTSIKRERKMNGEPSDDLDENTVILGSENQFRVNLETTKEKLADDVQPGVLEKVPHCKIHRMLMQRRKNPTAPELVYCWQVTELYPNDIMVCCSHCGTWRHAACGGHHKPYSVREAIVTPFVPVCDRCHEEEKILADYPLAQKRLERQRCEQIRRSLATSATMRQASFSKHGGTYKWPLGSVSATHIGGHTRSVHSRHDKAEKQWTDMATKLGRGYGYRPKERVKVRTKELERLLVSVEDAEGHTDRHNMLIFLLQDTILRTPVGFESNRKNIFDPEEEDNEVAGPNSDDNGDSSSSEDPSPNTVDPNEAGEKPFRDTAQELADSNENQKDGSLDEASIGEDESQDEESPIPVPSLCSRSGCTKKPRFDSVFCSDACGVSALESDLLRTFYYSSDIHPSSLRH